MKWFRMYYEARNDAKLKILSDGQFRCWFNLICFAAEQDPEGASVPLPEDRFVLAVEVVGGDEQLLEETLTALSKLRIIEIGEESIRFINFSRRQHDGKPSDAPDRVAERVRKHRASRNALNNSNVTPCNAPETRSNATELELEKELEQEKKEVVVVQNVREEPATETPPAAAASAGNFEAELDAIGKEFIALSLRLPINWTPDDIHAMKAALVLTRGDTGLIISTMKTTTERYAKKKNGDRITSFKYYLGPIRDAVALADARAAPVEIPQKTPADDSELKRKNEQLTQELMGEIPKELLQELMGGVNDG